MADDLIIVTNPEMPALTDSLKAIKTAEKMKKKINLLPTERKKNLEINNFNSFVVKSDFIIGFALLTLLIFLSAILFILNIWYY
jgi:MinD-like ATPase involved in chromosome partitioning or flagellar assembly